MLTSLQGMRVRTFLFITALLLCHLKLWPQTLTKQFPLATQSGTVAPQAAVEEKTPADAEASSADSLPQAPGYPIAEVIPAPPSGFPVRFQSDQQEKHGDIYTLSGEVRIDYKNYTLLADKITFNQHTSEAEALGHVVLEGGPDDELITADHGSMNLDLKYRPFLQRYRQHRHARLHQ